MNSHNEKTARKPHLPKNTQWMLRNLEGSGIPNSGLWLQAVGWSIEWSTEPNACCPIFHYTNIEDDFHWGLYSRFTSDEAAAHHSVCALVEVELDEQFRYRSTGRVRRHNRIPTTNCDYLCREEYNAYQRRNRPSSESLLRARAVSLLDRLTRSEWFRAAVPQEDTALSDIESLLRALPDAAARKDKRRAYTT